MLILVFLILLVLLFGAPFVLLGIGGVAAGGSWLVYDLFASHPWFLALVPIVLVVGIAKGIAQSKVRA